MYTYNDLSEAMNETWCKDCPSGYFCDEVAVANYTRFPCPVGFYCELASNAPIPCPSGTYRWVSLVMLPFPLPVEPTGDWTIEHFYIGLLVVTLYHTGYCESSTKSRCHSDVKCRDAGVKSFSTCSYVLWWYQVSNQDGRKAWATNLKEYILF